MYLPNNAGFIGLFMTSCNQRYSLKYYFIYSLGICFATLWNCGVNAISCSVLFVLDLSIDMVKFCGKQYIVLSSTEISWIKNGWV